VGGEKKEGFFHPVEGRKKETHRDLFREKKGKEKDELAPSSHRGLDYLHEERGERNSRPLCAKKGGEGISNFSLSNGATEGNCSNRYVVNQEKMS